MTIPKIENKVTAATAGAGAASVVASFVLWLLGTYVFKNGVPQEIHDFTLFAVAGAGAFVSGYVARHTYRPADTAPVVGEGDVPLPVPPDLPPASNAAADEAARVAAVDALMNPVSDPVKKAPARKRAAPTVAEQPPADPPLPPVNPSQ